MSHYVSSHSLTSLFESEVSEMLSEDLKRMQCRVDVRRSQMLQKDHYHIMNDFEDLLMCSPNWPSKR